MTTAREDATRLADLLRREHLALADFLVALAAFDRERRWVDLGYNSLFSFLVRELGLSKGAAFYRNRAAELLQEFPEVVEPLRDGRLCLSSVAELSNVLTAENVAEVLPRFFHLSRSEAKEVTAELKPDPAPPLRTVITTVPAPAAPSACAAQRGFPENLVRANSGVPDVVPPPAAQRPRRAEVKRAEVEPLTAELRRVHLTVSRTLVEKLAAARDALSHSHPGASDDVILEVGLDLVIQRFLKRRGIGAKPRKKPADVAATPDAPPAGSTAPAPSSQAPAPSSPVPAPSSPVPALSSPAPSPSSRAPSSPAPPPRGRSRYVPPDVWREVWARDGGRCAWPLEGGGVCGSTYQLELDHVEGLALGAGTTAKETRIACRPHNQHNARRLYGDAVMNRYSRPKGGAGCSEPVAAYGHSTTTSRTCHAVPPRRSRTTTTTRAGPRSKTVHLSAFVVERVCRSFSSPAVENHE